MHSFHLFIICTIIILNIHAFCKCFANIFYFYNLAKKLEKRPYGRFLSSTDKNPFEQIKRLTGPPGAILRPVLKRLDQQITHFLRRSNFHRNMPVLKLHF